jgi:hypothetical protein
MTRYPFAPIEEYIEAHWYPDDPARGIPEGHMTDARKADILTTTDGEIRRMREHGLHDLKADRYAIRLGLHPCLLWPTWFDDILADPADNPDIPHGTYTGYRAEIRYYGNACPACRNAARLRSRKQHQQRKARRAA